MALIRFSVLSYYTSFFSDECINVGVIFHNIDTDERIFESTKNWNRIEAFDDELNIEFMKEYLKGIKDSINRTVLNYDNKFILADYVRFFVNEYKFGPIQETVVPDAVNFIKTTKKMFLKFDYDKKERLEEKEEKAYIRTLLKSHNIEYSSGKIKGRYQDNINYDYLIDGYGIKLFTFEGKSLAHIVSNAKTWAFNALAEKDNIKTVFIYDTERVNSEYFDTIISILSSHAYKVLNLQDGISFLLSLNQSVAVG